MKCLGCGNMRMLVEAGCAVYDQASNQTYYGDLTWCKKCRSFDLTGVVLDSRDQGFSNPHAFVEKIDLSRGEEYFLSRGLELTFLPRFWRHIAYFWSEFISTFQAYQLETNRNICERVRNRKERVA